MPMLFNDDTSRANYI